MVADLAFCRARLGELRASALRLDSEGNVRGFDADTWAQADALAAALGDEVGDMLSLMRTDGRWSAWLHDPQWLLRWRQPDAWEACCRLYAADCAERALNLYGGDVDPRSREAIRVARLHAQGLASDAELAAAAWAAAAAADAAWAAARAAAWAAARGAAEAEEQRGHWTRLLQYAEHGPAAADMEWEVTRG